MKKFLSIFLILLLIFCCNSSLFKDVFNCIKFKINDVNEDTSIESQVDMTSFSNIKIGDTSEYVMNLLGKPDRFDKTEYNFNWYVYKNDKEKMVMVGIEDKKVVALFTNSINSCENENIDINKDINFIRNNYDVLKYKIKGNIKYKIVSNNEYDIIYKNKKYITVFYDKYDDNKIWAYEIIKYTSEDEMNNIYPKENRKIEESLMLEIIDLTNCTRYKNNLEPLEYNEKATISATKHSNDMKNNDYFDHVNLKKESPFDRMKKEGIYYVCAGENIAAGQTNAIFVHNGWMNSIGHRKNILGNYKYIGVGVVFGGNYKTYYTENFFG